MNPLTHKQRIQELKTLRKNLWKLCYEVELRPGRHWHRYRGPYWNSQEFIVRRILYWLWTNNRKWIE